MKKLKILLIVFMSLFGLYVSAGYIKYELNLKDGAVLNVNNSILVGENIKTLKMTDGNNICYIVKIQSRDVTTGLSISCLK